MTCDEWRDTLVAYVDNIVPLAVRRTVEQHLEECPACRREVEVWERTRYRVTTHFATQAAMAKVPESAP